MGQEEGTGMVRVQVLPCEEPLCIAVLLVQVEASDTAAAADFLFVICSELLLLSSCLFEEKDATTTHVSQYLCSQPLWLVKIAMQNDLHVGHDFLFVEMLIIGLEGEELLFVPSDVEA